MGVAKYRVSDNNYIQSDCSIQWLSSQCSISQVITCKYRHVHEMCYIWLVAVWSSELSFTYCHQTTAKRILQMRSAVESTGGYLLYL